MGDQRIHISANMGMELGGQPWLALGATMVSRRAVQHVGADMLPVPALPLPTARLQAQPTTMHARCLPCPQATCRCAARCGRWWRPATAPRRCAGPGSDGVLGGGGFGARHCCFWGEKGLQQLGRASWHGPPERLGRAHCPSLHTGSRPAAFAAAITQTGRRAASLNTGSLIPAPHLCPPLLYPPPSVGGGPLRPLHLGAARGAAHRR